ncbi:hypothetical protein HH213_17865 [Duganella dendranthematis]|uniref:Uncharacterized protein n=1 Tax=Duganella dendranthematis TaxID=2728021 RepID=A0ABX6MCS2_9BURK|nr:hypothetical protein [Duganella dendranthematis]QJD91789.1 hypothetical protein HH213_17865 [Duganella dendranthematis]
MGAVLEIDGLVFVEEKADVLGKPVAPVRTHGLPPMAQREFHARMENWRRVVMGGGGSSAAVCASWARWYVALRTSEAPPHQDVLDEKYKPPRPLVSADELDGWLVEEAYRKLGDFNDRMALKCRHIYVFDDARTRTRLKGVRGSHVRLVIARAENNLKTILKSFE